MNSTRRFIRHTFVFAFAWYVVTYSGQRVAGPFLLYSDCTAMAQLMSQQYSGISSVCQSSY